MKSTQQVVVDKLEAKAAGEGLAVMDSSEHGNTGVWRIVNDEGRTSELRYDFQSEYVRFGTFMDGESHRYQGGWHHILKRIWRFVDEAK